MSCTRAVRQVTCTLAELAHLVIASFVCTVALRIFVIMTDPTCRRKLYGNSRDAIERLHRQHKQHLREQHGPYVFPILEGNNDSVPELVHEYEVARPTVVASGVYVCACVCVCTSASRRNLYGKPTDSVGRLILDRFALMPRV